MTKQEKINKIAVTLAMFFKEREYFISALKHANNPDELEKIINDERWRHRRQEVARRFNKYIEEVL